MGYKCGMTVMTLDNLQHKAGDKHGNAKSVAQEALEERYGSDIDINKELTQNNIYDKHGFRNGQALYDYWMSEANAHSFTVGDKVRKMRSDCKIGYAGIIKPQMEYVNGMDVAQQKRFFNDAIGIVKDIYKKQGLTVDAAVIQFDEQAAHVHYFGHDKEYRMSKKVNLALYDKLNREFPQRMRSKGWDLVDLTGYKEETAGMNADELHEYKSKKRSERRTRHNRTSKEYKADREVEKSLEAATARCESILEHAQVEAQAIKKQAESEAQEFRDAQDERQQALDEKETALDMREAELKRKAQLLGRSELFEQNSSSQVKRRAQPEALDYMQM